MYLMRDEPDAPELSDGFIGWTAGIMDGEGTITIIQDRRPGREFLSHHLVMRAQVANTDLAMIETLHAAWGGYFRLVKETRPNRADQYHWYISSNQAARMLKIIEPYLVTKKLLAQLCIAFQDRRANHVGWISSPRPGPTLSEEEKETRVTYFQQVKHLNDKTRKHKIRAIAA